MQPNRIGKGIRIVHLGGGIIVNCNSCGDNLTITAGCVVGNKGDKNNRPTIGNNVELTLGSKVIGRIEIGDDVVVCPNSVVIKDVPSNQIVSGVPIQIMKPRKN